MSSCIILFIVEAEWRMQVSDKRKLLADALKEGGGRMPGVTRDDQNKKATDVELVAFHGNSCDFYRELIWSFHAQSVTDYTPLSDNGALAAIRMRVAYTGVCFTEFHAAELRKRLCERTFNAITDPTSELYEPMALADMMTSKEARRVEDDGEDGRAGKFDRHEGGPPPKRSRNSGKGGKGKGTAQTRVSAPAATDEDDLDALLDGLKDEESGAGAE
jgi:hypothetical protein